MINDMITSSLVDQFDRSLQMFRAAVTSLPTAEWTKGVMDYLRPAGVAYHVVETIEFYCGDIPADKFAWGGRFGCDWEDPDHSKLPTQSQILMYDEDVWANAKDWIVSHDLAMPENIFPWTGSCLHGRLLYLLRHIQHHTAEMSLELKRRGVDCPDWI